MAGNNALNNNDSMDINELAALNSDISPELIEQLQQKLSADAESFGEKTTAEFDVNDDSTLFEEPAQEKPEQENPVAEEQKETPAETSSKQTKENSSKQQAQISEDIDDNFIKKYKARLDKQRNSLSKEYVDDVSAEKTESLDSTDDQKEDSEGDINKLTNGIITEKAITQAQKEYNDSLDLLDGNVKYSKYVIYIDPQNVDFIESLTVKERKNLINNILREQDDVGITRKKFRMVQTIIKHTIIAILTITISIPIIYWTINASLEASINNHRRAETNWGTLYKEHGKINVKQPGGN